MSLFVAVVVIISAWQIVKSRVDILVDSASVNSDDIMKLLMPVPGIFDIHQIRSRGEESHVFIDLYVVVNPDDRQHTDD